MSRSSSEPAINSADWVVSCEGYDATDEGRREAIFALGNGVFVTRAASTDSRADDVHYPGTYRAGCYDRAVSEIAGEEEENVSLVNLPNWLPLTFRIDEGPWLNLDNAKLQHYQHSVDLRRGLAHRSFVLADPEGRLTRVCEQRLVSMAAPHLAALRTDVTPLNWSGTLTFRSTIDGEVINNNVPRYGDYERRHLSVTATGTGSPDRLWLQSRTLQSRIDVAQAVRTRIPSASRSEFVENATGVSHLASCEAEQDQTLSVEKTAALFTSHDPGVTNALGEALDALASEKDFGELVTEHEDAWRALWDEADIQAQYQPVALALRFHVFHLLQTVSPHTAALDVGVPARGWHGEGYRGHIFWDELFVFPFLNFRFPQVARSLLLYRYRRLDAARSAARAAGLSGAMFPWRSGIDGREATPDHQKNLISGHWLEDPTHLQRHIGSAIAYNVWHYFLATGDRDFLAHYGAELIFEIARFWSSLATYSPQLKRYEIKGVIGPDEYHNSYPDKNVPGLDNNAYTNLTAVWTLCCALDVLEQLPGERREQLLKQLAIDSEELRRWDDISHRMRMVFHDDGIMSQFEGFEKLHEFSRDQLPPKVAEKRIDWALEAVGETADAYQVTKQADTLTLFYLFPPQEIERLLARLGYDFLKEDLMRTADYYLARTTHRSSLSRVTYAGALAHVDSQRSWHFFEEALETDLQGLKGESIAEGIHMGAMGGTLDVLQRRYLGIAPCVEGLRVDPALPRQLGEIDLTLTFRGNRLRAKASGSGVTLYSSVGNDPVEIFHADTQVRLAPGAQLSIKAQAGSTAA